MSEGQHEGVVHPTEHRWLVTFGTMLATIIQALDTTIANVALPHMQGTFSATLDQISWVLTSYLVAAAVMTPPTGWLSARYGRKNLYVVSVAGFTLASVLCGMSATLGQMVVFRLLQGAFGAALVPLSQAILLDSYPRERHGAAMAIWGVGIMVGPILGPTLGGWLTDSYTWRWVFYINVPIGLLAFVIISAFVSETKRNRDIRFDVIGFATISLAVAALQMFLDRGELKDWFGSTEIVIEAAMAGLFFYVFLVHTFTTDMPFIRPNLFADRNFSVSLVLMLLVGAVLYATLTLTPSFLQNLLDYPVLTTGLVIAPRGIGSMLAMLVIGRLITRVDPRFLLMLGLALVAGSLYWTAKFSLYVGIDDIIWSGALQGVGFGFVWVPISTIAFSTLEPSRRTEASGIFNLLRNIGASAGISIVAAFIDRNMQINHEQLAAAITPYNPLLRMPVIKQFWDIHTATGAAALNAEITRQAGMIAYIDDFKMMMIATLAMIPLVLLLSWPKRKAGQGEMSAVMD